MVSNLLTLITIVVNSYNTIEQIKNNKYNISSTWTMPQNGTDLQTNELLVTFPWARHFVQSQNSIWVY